MKPHIAGRVHAQGLDGPRFASAADVVRHLACVQSQLHDMALWSLARRTTGEPTLAQLQASFDAGDFLRTHILRPTWHFVDPADIHWLLALTAPRVRRLLASQQGATGIDQPFVDRAETVVRELLAGGPLTRTQLGAGLGEAGLPVDAVGLAQVAAHLEIAAVIASGPVHGKQHTYRLLPPAPPLPSRDDLLADVARRYGRGHGPFRDKDLAWWTSLTLTDSRRAIQLGELRPTDDGYWTVDDPVSAEVPDVMLLANYDEYVSYARDPDDFDAFGGTPGDVMRGAGLLMVRGRLAGQWSRTVTGKRVELAVVATPALTAAMRRRLDDEASAYGRFLAREATVAIRQA